jgi:Transglutaminase-like superfamily
MRRNTVHPPHHQEILYMSHPLHRRQFTQALLGAGAVSALSGYSSLAQAQAAATERKFDPQPGQWRRFEMNTRVEVLKPEGASQLWIPLPSINTDYQHSLSNQYETNGSARVVGDGKYGAKMLHVQFAAGTAQPFAQVSSLIETQNRKTDWSKKTAVHEDAATLKSWTAPTALLPTDGIVRETALEATKGAKTDLEKVRGIYNWVVKNTFREPKVRGCGTGDIKDMLETGNMGGKCGDINGLFVGLCRAAGIPARDVYGIRLVPSTFGYKELSGDPANLKSAQHCRAEVFLAGYGWVAMDPADVGKVMRLETPEWLKTTQNPVVAPVNKALFGGWEGNWLAYNNAHDVALPGSKGAKLGFFMYPNGESAKGRMDQLDPDNFKYTINARELKA